jgi:hypothetical protein
VLSLFTYAFAFTAVSLSVVADLTPLEGQTACFQFVRLAHAASDILQLSLFPEDAHCEPVRLLGSCFQLWNAGCYRGANLVASVPGTVYMGN